MCLFSNLSSQDAPVVDRIVDMNQEQVDERVPGVELCQHVRFPRDVLEMACNYDVLDRTSLVRSRSYHELAKMQTNKELIINL